MKTLSTMTAIFLASTALAWAADVGKPEMPRMHKTFEANPARFDHDYVGKSFATPAVVTEIVKRAANSYSVTLDTSIVCPDVSVEAAQSFNKGDTVNLTGTVAAYSPQAMELGQCTFSRSVPVEEPVAAIAPESPQNAQQADQEWKSIPQAPQAPAAPQQPPLIRKESFVGESSLPPVMTMSCTPADGSPSFNVRVVTDGSDLRVGGPRFYTIARADNQANHILYIAAKRRNAVMYFAFDHSRFKDESATLVKEPGHENRAKCQVAWQSVDNR